MLKGHSNNRSLHNPNVSEEAKASAEERLHQLPEHTDKNPGHVIAGIKSCVPTSKFRDLYITVCY